VAYICSGDGIPASIYAGRYLAKWPLENDLLASEGYDPRAFTGTTYFGSPAYVFTTKDGKRCIGGIPEVSGSYTALLPSAWRTKGLTYSVSVYANSLHDPIAGRGIMLLNTGAPFAGDIWNQSGNRGFQVFINGGYLQLATFSLAELLDVWSHYVISVSPAGIVKGYRNGVLVGAASTTANICYSVSSITGSVYATPSTGESQAFYRNMRAYGYALTDAEVAALAAEDLA
jgi:hypothetical protein